MAELILSIIGVEGQRLAGIEVGKLVGKQICESIRSSFKTDMIEKYKELSTEATKSILGDTDGMKKLTAALITTFEGMSIKDFKLTSKDSSIKGGGIMDGGVGEEEKKNPTAAAINPINGAADDVKNKLGDLTKNNTLANPIPDVGALSGAGALPAIDQNNQPNGLPGAELIKSAVQGLKPDEGVVPGYLVDALNKELIKSKMIEGFGQFINELTTKNSNDLKKAFLDILKEQINEKFRSKDGDKIFRETIINIIQEKCIKTCDPENGKCDKVNPKMFADFLEKQPEKRKTNPNDKHYNVEPAKKDGTPPNEPNPTKDESATKEDGSATKEDGSQPAEGTEQIKGGKSNKPSKRFTRKISK